MDLKGNLKIGQLKCESTLIAAEQSRRAAAKAPVGAQIKRVIHLLFETRKAFTPDQINEMCYVDLKANKAVFDSLKNNLKVHYDGNRFSYKPKHDVKDKIGLFNLIDTCSDGISVDDLKDAYPNAMEDLQSLKVSGQIRLLSNMAYPNSSGINVNVVDDLKMLFRSIDLPSEMLDVEKDLLRSGIKPATKTDERRVATKRKSIAPKSKPKKRKPNITKLTNAHLPELFFDI